MSLFTSSSSAPPSGPAGPSKASAGDSLGVSTKATLFLAGSNAYHLCFVGGSGLVVCCKPRGAQAETCGTRHNGTKFVVPEANRLVEMVFVHDPKNKYRFLSEHWWAMRCWFSEGTLRVWAVSHKTVPECPNVHVKELFEHSVVTSPFLTQEDRISRVTRNVMSGERGAGTLDYRLLEIRVAKNEKSLDVMKVRADKTESKLEAVEKSV
jgi:hypothetical protein